MIKFYLNEAELVLLNEKDLIGEEQEQDLLYEQTAEISDIKTTTGNVKTIDEQISIEKSLASLSLADAHPSERDITSEKREKGS